MPPILMRPPQEMIPAPRVGLNPQDQLARDPGPGGPPMAGNPASPFPSPQQPQQTPDPGMQLAKYAGMDSALETWNRFNAPAQENPNKQINETLDMVLRQLEMTAKEARRPVGTPQVPGMPKMQSFGDWMSEVYPQFAGKMMPKTWAKSAHAQYTGEQKAKGDMFKLSLMRMKAQLEAAKFLSGERPPEMTPIERARATIEVAKTRASLNSPFKMPTTFEAATTRALDAKARIKQWSPQQHIDAIAEAAKTLKGVTGSKRTELQNSLDDKATAALNAGVPWPDVVRLRAGRDVGDKPQTTSQIIRTVSDLARSIKDLRGDQLSAELGEESRVKIAEQILELQKQIDNHLSQIGKDKPKVKLGDAKMASDLMTVADLKELWDASPFEGSRLKEWLKSGVISKETAREFISATGFARK